MAKYSIFRPLSSWRPSQKPESAVFANQLRKYQPLFRKKYCDIFLLLSFLLSWVFFLWLKQTIADINGSKQNA